MNQVISDTVEQRINYTFTVGSIETLARIYLEIKGLAHAGDLWKTLLDEFGELTENVSQYVSRILPTYEGLYKPILRVTKKHNLVPDRILELHASQAVGNVVSPSFAYNYVALGTDGTPVAASDQKLGNEVLRGTWSNRYAIGKSAYLDKFFTTAEVSGFTFQEAGAIIDGTPDPDTGFLGSHVNMNETIGPNETLTINAEIKFISA